MKNNDYESNYEYDEIAENVYFPIFDYIADGIIRETGITSGQMLDIGSGGGHLAYSVMQKTALDGYLVDINPAAVKIAEKRAEDRGLAERTQVAVQDVHDMFLPDEFADLIISRGSYLFWENQEKAFKEIYRVLKTGGATYIGAGLGSREQHMKIKAEMQKRQPGWESPMRKSNYCLSTEEYRKMFDDFGWNYKILDGEEGRWIIIKK